MSKKLLLSIPMLLALSVAGSIAAQQNSPSPGQEPGRRGMGGAPPVLGTITSVGVDRFEIKKPDGATQTVLVDDQTRIRQRPEQRQEQQQQPQAPQELQLEDLKVGDHVMVRGTPNADKQAAAMFVSRITAEQFERFQSGGGPGGGPGGGAGGGQRGPGGGGGFGPGGGGPNAGTRAGGQIVSIDGNQIKVQSRRGERVIVVNDQTTFSKEGKTITLKDLKVGDRIFATGKEVDGKFVVTEVRSGFPGGGRGGWQGQQN
jgi:hypothetical protein